MPSTSNLKPPVIYTFLTLTSLPAFPAFPALLASHAFPLCLHSLSPIAYNLSLVFSSFLALLAFPAYLARPALIYLVPIHTPTTAKAIFK